MALFPVIYSLTEDSRFFDGASGWSVVIWCLKKSKTYDFGLAVQDLEVEMYSIIND